MDKNNTLAMLITGIVGIAVGAIGILATQPKGSNSRLGAQSIANVREAASQDTRTRAADFRVALNAGHRQYTSLLISTSHSVWDDRGDAAAASSATDAVTKTLATNMRSVYGSAAEQSYYRIWSSQIRFLMDYTSALKTGNAAAKAASLTNMQGFVDAMVGWNKDVGTPYNAATLRSTLQQLVAVTKSVVDNYGNKKYEATYQAAQTADRQATTLADAEAAAIVKQHPEKF